jgi:putative transposase
LHRHGVGETWQSDCPCVFIMARKHRIIFADCVYHVCNRGSRKGVLFDSYDDYDDYLQLMEEARAKYCMRITAFSLMRTHVHFVLWPRTDSALQAFMKKVSEEQAQDFHRKHNSRGTGAVYQSRYYARELDDARNYFGTVRYVEQNPLKDGYVRRAQDWPWCSAWDGEGGPRLFVVDAPPIPYLPNWDEILNEF